MRVGFIGLGSQGAPMARRIIDAGYSTTLWARRPQTLAPFAQTGAAMAPTAAALAAAVDIIEVCVWDDEAVEEVLCGPSGVLEGARPGSVIAIHSTVAPTTCERLGDVAMAQRVPLVDAPVSGGYDAAVAGRLLVMVGGEAAAFERCLPVFETFGDPVVHVGPIGSGQLTKLVNNALLAASIGLADAALSLGSLLGLERQGLAEALRHGSAHNPGLGYLLRLEALAAADRAGLVRIPRSRTADWAKKDVGLAAQAASRHGVGQDHVLLSLGERGVEIVDGYS